MSLFGDEDEPAARPSKSSLFADTSPSKSQKPASTSMFGDDGAADANDEDGASPWGFTPRKNNAAAGRSLLRSLLAGAEVPEIYIDTFDAVQEGGRVLEREARALLAQAGVSGAAQASVWEIVVREKKGGEVVLERNEFNVFLALVGLAQEGEELSLDAVDERRRKLPVPALASGRKQQRPATPPSQGGAAAAPHHHHQQQQQQSTSARKQSFGAGFGESDPWASPAMHKGHGHINGIGSGPAPQRTTSTFTTSAAEPSEPAGSGSYSAPPPTNSEGASWGGSTYNAGNGDDFGHGSSASGAGGFGGDDNNPGANLPRRAAGTTRATASKGVEELVTVQLLEEKEGMFMFQHRNYEVASVRRNSKVIRRYSDFVWLLDCLHKRYPFRQLPLLPPKRVQINGNHLAADSGFLEKRRRGLARFANALVRHPVLREEQLVVMFLTVPTELAVWRKQATISVQEEFAGKPLPPTLEDSLPADLTQTLDTVRGGVRRSADLYIALCTLTERLCKRKEALAGDANRFRNTLTSLTDASIDTYAMDASEVPVLNEGLASTARHIGSEAALGEDEARAWDEGFLEDLKTMRDGLVSVREMFDRRDRLARDNIPQLERRIQSNEQKLQGIKAKGAAAKAGEAEKVENAIINDKQSIVDQHARGVFILECLRDELLVFQHSQYRVSRLLQDWAQERVKYAELLADNFRGLVDAVEGMPLGE